VVEVVDLVVAEGRIVQELLEWKQDQEELLDLPCFPTFFLYDFVKLSVI
jgi:hypothetical protein